MIVLQLIQHLHFNNEYKCKSNHRGRHADNSTGGKAATLSCDRECETCSKFRTAFQ